MPPWQQPFTATFCSSTSPLPRTHTRTQNSTVGNLAAVTAPPLGSSLRQAGRQKVEGVQALTPLPPTAVQRTQRESSARGLTL
jgi:hypothetical protein